MEPGDVIRLIGGAFGPGSLQTSKSSRLAVISNESVITYNGRGDYEFEVTIALEKLVDDWCCIHGIDRIKDVPNAKKVPIIVPPNARPSTRPPQSFLDENTIVSIVSEEEVHTSISRNRTNVEFENISKCAIWSAIWSSTPKHTAVSEAQKSALIHSDFSRFDPTHRAYRDIECLAINASPSAILSSNVGKEVSSENLVMILPHRQCELFDDSWSSPSHKKTNPSHSMDIDAGDEKENAPASNTLSFFENPNYLFISPCANYEEPIIDIAWVPRYVETPLTAPTFSQYIAIAVRDTIQFWWVDYDWTLGKIPDPMSNAKGRASLVMSFTPFPYPEMVRYGDCSQEAKSPKNQGSIKEIEKVFIEPSPASASLSTLYICFYGGLFASYTISLGHCSTIGLGSECKLLGYPVDKKSKPQTLKVFEKAKFSIPLLALHTIFSLQVLSVTELESYHIPVNQRDLTVLTQSVSFGGDSSSNRSAAQESCDNNNIIVLTGGGTLCLVSETDTIQHADSDSFVNVTPISVIQAHLEAISSATIMPFGYGEAKYGTQFNIFTTGLDGMIRIWKFHRRDQKEPWKSSMMLEQELMVLLEKQMDLKDDADDEPPGEIYLPRAQILKFPANSASSLTCTAGACISPNGLFTIVDFGTPYRQFKLFHYLIYLRIRSNTVIQAIKNVSRTYNEGNATKACIWDIVRFSSSLPNSAITVLVKHITAIFEGSTTQPNGIRALSNFPLPEAFVLNAILCKWLKTNMPNLFISDKGPSKNQESVELELQHSPNTPSKLFITEIPDTHAKSDSFSITHIIYSLVQLRAIAFLSHTIQSLSKLAWHKSKPLPSNGRSMDIDQKVSFPESVEVKNLSHADWTILIHFAVLLNDALVYLPKALVPAGKTTVDALMVIIGKIPDKSPATLMKRLSALKGENKHNLAELTAQNTFTPTSIESLFVSSKHECEICLGRCASSFPSPSFALFALVSSQLAESPRTNCPETDFSVTYCAASGMPIKTGETDSVKCAHCHARILRAEHTQSWISSTCPFCCFSS